ncbi:MAG TPA: tetratricopeptide repeat protein, partial [Plasticicumulans sp.]|nr:tetratricopeptide repeat protein [Plasticicumulans sp.]
PTEPLVGQPLPAAPAAPATPPPPRPAPAPAPVASAPAAPSAPAEPEAERGGNNAVVALIDSANTYVRNNELDKAAASLERAQRLEPRNPNILYDLAQVRAHQAQYGQSEALAQKSIALAGGNKALQAKAWRLIAAVRRAGGNAAGGDAAEAQAVTLGGR